MYPGRALRHLLTIRKEKLGVSTMGYERILMNTHEYLSSKSHKVLLVHLNSISLSVSSTFHGSVVLSMCIVPVAILRSRNHGQEVGSAFTKLI